MKKLRYGSPASLSFLEKLFAFIANEAYKASSRLAEEKGSFPAYNFDDLLKSAFFTSLEGETKTLVRQKGLRNLTLLAQAPGGTISSLVSTSSGIEPYFDWITTVNTRLGQVEEIARPFHVFRSQFPLEPLPDYFRTANEISWEEHIMVQSVIQKYTDASVSKTINLPENASLDDVANCIFRLHELGCKGGAIYRDKSRSFQAIEKNTVNSKPLARLIPLPEFRHGITVTTKTHFGNLHATFNFDTDQKPLEVFLEVGKAGSDIKAMTEALGRLISLCLRLDANFDKDRLVELMAEQLQGIKSSPSGLGVLSLPDAVAKMMRTYVLGNGRIAMPLPSGLEGREPSREGLPLSLSGQSVYDLCPECGYYALKREGNCTSCIYCGFSAC